MKLIKKLLIASAISSLAIIGASANDSLVKKKVKKNLYDKETW